MSRTLPLERSLSWGMSESIRAEGVAMITEDSAPGWPASVVVANEWKIEMYGSCLDLQYRDSVANSGRKHRICSQPQRTGVDKDSQSPINGRIRG